MDGSQDRAERQRIIDGNQCICLKKDVSYKGCNITLRTSIGNISSISEHIPPFPRSVYVEIDENSRNQVPMDVRGVVLQCLRQIMHRRRFQSYSTSLYLSKC